MANGSSLLPVVASRCVASDPFWFDRYATCTVDMNSSIYSRRITAAGSIFGPVGPSIELTSVGARWEGKRWADRRTDGRDQETNETAGNTLSAAT